MEKEVWQLCPHALTVHVHVYMYIHVPLQYFVHDDHGSLRLLKTSTVMEPYDAYTYKCMYVSHNHAFNKDDLHLSYFTT